METSVILPGAILIIIILAAAFLLRGGEQPAPQTAPEPPEPTGPFADDSQATEETVSEVVEGNNRFALDLYSKFKESEEGNIFFSPYSISTALAMTYEGARGQTADEMESVLHFPEDSTSRRSGFARLYNLLNQDQSDYQLSTANALWAQEDYRFLDEYFGIVERYYKGRVTNLDFVGDTENSRTTINDWVEEQTMEKIKDLIPPGAIDQLTRLVLTNAIYFKGTWVMQFNESKTQDEDFRTGSGSTVKVPMMRLLGEDFNYAETEQLQILELPYEGEDLSMMILLPKGDDLSAVEGSLDLTNLSEWRSMLTEHEIDIYIPRFKFETKYFMKETLSGMGMPTAFDMYAADLSGMDGGRCADEGLCLYISKVIHQAFVEVNEEGTEAAAATAVIVSLRGLPSEPKVFRADHPFIFIIQEKSTGSVLFLGRVVDPTAA